MIQPSYPALSTGEIYVPGLSAEHVAEKYGIALNAISKLGSAETRTALPPKHCWQFERRPRKFLCTQTGQQPNCAWPSALNLASILRMWFVDRVKRK